MARVKTDQMASLYLLPWQDAQGNWQVFIGSQKRIGTRRSLHELVVKSFST